MHTMRVFLFTLLFVLLGMLVPNIMRVEALQGKILTPIADSYVWNEAPDWNRGKEWNLIVQENGIERIVFLMFDLSQIPTGASIDESKLRLFTNDVDIKAPVSTHYCSSNGWTEDGITYNNKPSFSETPIDALNVTKALTWYEWNVTDATQTALTTADRKLSLVLKAGTHGGIVFRSKDNPWATPPYPDTRPKLEVLYVAPPSGNDASLTLLIVIVIVGAVAIGLELTYIRLKRRRPTDTNPTVRSWRQIKQVFANLEKDITILLNKN